MQSSTGTVSQYLQNLSAERRQFVQTLRQVIAASIDPRFVETLQYGMITWVIPKSIYPPGYHCKPADCVPFLSLASQKNAVSIHLMNIYYDKSLEARLCAGWEAAGLKPDLGKACLRVRQLSETALPVLAEIVAATTLDAYLEHYVGVLSKGRKASVKAEKGKAEKGKASSGKSAQGTVAQGKPRQAKAERGKTQDLKQAQGKVAEQPVRKAVRKAAKKRAPGKP